MSKVQPISWTEVDPKLTHTFPQTFVVAKITKLQSVYACLKMSGPAAYKLFVTNIIDP